MRPPTVGRADDKKKPGLFDFESWKTPAGHQRDAIKQLAPGGLELTPAAAFTGEPRPIRLRIYADSDYRQIVLRWKRVIRDQIEHANRVLQPVFNVRFEVEALRPWERSHVGAAIDPVLVELEALDQGREVDWVVGLITPFRGVATSMHQLGSARTLSRHFVLRGMDDEQESLALDRELSLLPVNERQGVYGERKTHKETVVLLHEWAHTLGALHNEDPVAIMNPVYDARRAMFSLFEKEQLAFVLDRRLDHPGELYPESSGLTDLLARTPPEEGSEKERAALLALARARERQPAPSVGATSGNSELAHPGSGGGAAAPGHVDAPPVTALDLPAADVATYNRVVDAVNAGHLDDAWTQLQPLGRAYPLRVAVAGLACSLVAGHPAADEARALCDAAVKLEPTNVRLPLDAAASYLRANRGVRAAELLLATAPHVAAGDTRSWLRLAGMALAAGALSAGDAALAHTPATDPEVTAMVEKMEAQRMRSALTRDAAARWGIAPEREAIYQASFEDAQSVMATGKDLGARRARVAAFTREFPGCPGADVLACELELRAGRPAVATKRCEDALRKFGHATRALYLLGVEAEQRQRTDLAERYLRKAMLLVPRDPAAWRELARLYRSTRANQRLADLAAEHQSLLAAPLPE